MKILNTRHEFYRMDRNILVKLKMENCNFLNKIKKSNGNGVYSYKDGRTYDGDWVENKMEGLGIFIWPGIINFLYKFKMEEDMKEAM